MSETVAGGQAAPHHELIRTLTWRDAFWVGSGVPALVLFSVGGIAATVGTPSWLCWMISVIFGFFQAFIYAEMAGLFPSKSGGVAVYGASAWFRYSKFLAPLSPWANWLAWTPVLTIGATLASGYILSTLFAPDAWIVTANLSLIDLGFLKEGLEIRINALAIIAAVLLMITFFIQNHGILGTARVQMIVGIAALTPLLLIGIVPFFTGDIVSSNFTPFVPLSGAWDKEGWALIFGALFLAAWSTYGFETAVCYTREFRNPKKDAFRAIFWSGILCLVVFTIVPLAFQGYLGVSGMTNDAIVDGTGVGSVMAAMVGGRGFVANLIIVMLVLALFLSISTTMAGTSRTLYQGSVDGWLPLYLSKVNEHGAPTRAMWTSLSYNLVLLVLSDTLFVLAVACVCYLVSTFLNVQAGWIHRIDNAQIDRPYRCPNWILGVGTVVGFINAFLLGAGANLWGKGTLIMAIIALALIFPMFLYRHYIVDGGKFTKSMLEEMHVDAGSTAGKAGWLPYGTLALGLVLVFGAQYYFHGIFL